MPDKKLTEGTTALDYEGTLKNLTKEYYDALDLINRQKAEIERLKLAQPEEVIKCCIECIDTIKAEAYKEFAERLKQVFWSKAECDFLIRGIVDNLLKEMVGEDNG